MQNSKDFQECLAIIDQLREAAKKDPALNKALINIDNMAREEGRDPDEFLYQMAVDHANARRAKEWLKTKVSGS